MTGEALAVIDVAPMPAVSGARMVEAFNAYRTLQADLDKAMPDCLMELGERSFRKKQYWRAIAMAFNVSVEPVTPEQAERSVVGFLEGGAENYCYTVTYRATLPSGRSVTGDGTCAAAEKQKGRMEATEHNVRSHAHTRAYNRAVSNLVGFGEVSAEEVERDEHDGATKPATTKAAATKTSGPSLKIAKVELPSGEGKPWKLTLEDGRTCTDFDLDNLHVAQEGRTLGLSLEAVDIVEVKKDNRTYHNMRKGFKLRLVKQVAEDIPFEDNEPVGQPEVIKSLASRKVSDAFGDHKKGDTYWVVQTDRRIYITFDEQIGGPEGIVAGVKKANGKILVAFDIGEDRKHKKFREISQVQIAPDGA